LKLPFLPGSEASDNAASSDTAPLEVVPPVATSAPLGTRAALLGQRKAGLGGLGNLLPMPRLGGPALARPELPLPGSAEQPAGAGKADDGGHFMLRCGQLLMSAEARMRS
jgi:hypothetical protein